MRMHFLLLFIIVATSVSASLTLSTERSEYYFPLSQQAQLIVDVSNTAGIDLVGVMSYTSSQKVQTANTVLQSSNSNSQQFTIPKDMASFGVGLGTSKDPAELDLTLTFNYNDENGTAQQTSLEGIKIFFVDDKQQQQQQSESKRSQTQSQEELKKQHEKQQEEEQKRLEEQMKEQMRQQEEASKLQNRIQNNQKAQDSNALKQQMEKDLQEKNQLKEQFKRSLENNPEFQRQMQEIMQQGFNQTGAELNPTNTTSGDFKVDFQDEFGNNLSLKGSMNDTKLENIETEMEFSLDYMKSLIQKDPRYGSLNSKLMTDRFQEGNWTIERDGNSTTVSIAYSDGRSNKTMVAELEGTEIISIRMKEISDFLSMIAIVLVVVVILSVIFYYLHKKNKVIHHSKHLSQDVGDELFDHVTHAKKLLEEAKYAFQHKEYKDAYSLASQAIRVYYSHEIDIKKEITNHDLITELKKRSIAYKDTQRCLNMCSMVEFARYTANKEDFEEIIGLAESIIK